MIGKMIVNGNRLVNSKSMNVIRRFIVNVLMLQDGECWIDYEWYKIVNGKMKRNKLVTGKMIMDDNKTVNMIRCES